MTVGQSGGAGSIGRFKPMERMSISLLTVFAVFALVVAACGGDDGAGTLAPDLAAAVDGAAGEPAPAAV